MSLLETNLSLLLEQIHRLNDEASNKSDYSILMKSLTHALQGSYELDKGHEWDRLVYGVVNPLAKLLATDMNLEDAIIKEMGSQNYRIAEKFLKGIYSAKEIEKLFKQGKIKGFEKFKDYMFFVLRSVLYALETLV